MTPVMRAHMNVNIGDVSLSREDIALLVPPRWINDQLITAAFELLRTRTLPGDSGWLAVGASEAMMMAHLDDPAQLRMLFEPLKLQTRRLVLFPVSDHDEPDVAGGTHWSLLAFYRRDGVESFYHFDSLSHINAASAEHLARRVAPLLGTRQTRVVACPTPQQENGYDCGMYTIQIAEICAAHVGEDVAAVGEIINSEVTPEAIRRRRKAFILTLQELMGKTAAAA
jgi:sentrin-specific protease 8